MTKLTISNKTFKIVMFALLVKATAADPQNSHATGIIRGLDRPISTRRPTFSAGNYRLADNRGPVLIKLELTLGAHVHVPVKSLVQLTGAKEGWGRWCRSGP